MNNKPLVESKNLYEFFSLDQSYLVPAYQREYAWEQEQITALTDDLHAFAHSDAPYYLLGQIILAPNADNDFPSYNFAVVDGQQRLTSLYLLFLALVRQYSAFGISTSENSDHSAALRMLNTAIFVVRPSDGEEQPRLRATPQANKPIEKILQHETLGKLTLNASEENVHNNFDDLSSWVRNALDTKDALTSFTKQLFSSVYVVVASLESEEQALEIFEKLNNRGMPLNSAQLFKALMFMHVSQNNYKQIDEKWSAAGEEMFRVKPRSAGSMEYLMQAMLQPVTGQYVASKGVHKEWQKVFRETSVSMPEFAERILESAKMMAQIGSGSVNVYNKDFTAANYFGVVQYFPIALVATNYAKRDAQTYERLSKFIDARIALSIFAKEGAQYLNTSLWGWSKRVSDAGLDASFDDLVNQIDFTKSHFDALIESARPKFLNLTYRSNHDKKRIKYAFAFISSFIEEQAKNPEVKIQEILKSSRGNAYDLDHIFPRSQQSAAHFDAVNGTDWLDNIGNLCLLHPQDNRQAQDAMPIRKSPHYASSALVLTKSLAAQQDRQNLNPRLLGTIELLNTNGSRDVSNWAADAAYEQAEFYFEMFKQALASHVGLG
jgi:hypothetical protein